MVFLELESCSIEFQKVQRRYEQLLQSAPDAMVFINNEEKIVLINAQLGALFGYSKEELMGSSLDHLIPEKHREHHHANVRDYFKSPDIRPMGTHLSIYGRRKDCTEFPADISLSPFETEDGIVAVAAIRDITERKKAEFERQRMREQLAEVEKLSALGRITANVADEIRNPLTSVGGFARRLLKIADSDRERNYAENIIAEVGRLETVLVDILAFARRRSPLLEDHDIRNVIEKVLLSHDERFRQQSVDIRRSPSDGAIVRIDRSQIEDAFERLIANALDAMPQGGTLSISADSVLSEAVPYVRIRIIDTGEGIPREKLSRVFEPFFTARGARKGTGLGLSIARSIIEEEGGNIGLESTEGVGTTVTVSIPVIEY